MLFSNKSIFSALLSLFLCYCVFGAERSFTWNLEWKTLGNDFNSKIVIGINNQCPPPSIEVDVGDTISLTVNNLNIGPGVTLHAHGFHQLNNVQYDGPEGITQWSVYSVFSCNKNGLTGKQYDKTGQEFHVRTSRICE
jgi:hypothetical protein